MKIRKIIYLTPLDEILDSFNDNIDVLVELDDGNCYTTVVITPKNISQLINVVNKDGLSRRCASKWIIGNRY